MIPFNHLILYYPLLLLPSVFPSTRVLSNELAFHIRWPKYWSFIFHISRSNEYSGLISFKIDWFNLLADQGTLKSLLQHHNLKASIPQCSAFFMVQLSHPYMKRANLIFLKKDKSSYKYGGWRRGEGQANCQPRKAARKSGLILTGCWSPELLHLNGKILFYQLFIWFICRKIQ